MGAKYSEIRTLPGPIEFYINKIRNIGFYDTKYNVLNEQPIVDGLLFLIEHGVSFSSWGENVKLALIYQGDYTIVDIYSECVLPTQIFDFGKNKENVTRLFNYLIQENLPLQQIYSQPEQNESCPPQAEANKSIVCPNCRRVLNITDNFCWGCGTKLK